MRFSSTARIALPARRGALTSVFYACAYVGFAAPFGTALAARHGGPGRPLAVASLLAGLIALRLVPVARRPAATPAQAVAA